MAAYRGSRARPASRGRGSIRGGRQQPCCEPRLGFSCARALLLDRLSRNMWFVVKLFVTSYLCLKGPNLLTIPNQSIELHRTRLGNQSSRVSAFKNRGTIKSPCSFSANSFAYWMGASTTHVARAQVTSYRFTVHFDFGLWVGGLYRGGAWPKQHTRNWQVRNSVAASYLELQKSSVTQVQRAGN